MIDDLREAAWTLDHAARIMVFSGAGLSKASGIPTYREMDGLWANEENVKYSRVDGYRADPRGFTKFWKSHRALLKGAQPNSAHYALRKLQLSRPSTILATQNVDNLLNLAGCEGVLELHGNLHRQRCSQCATPAKFAFLGRCHKCFAPLRPEVVMFGEDLPEPVYDAAFEAAEQCNVMILIGTSALVYPAAELPEIAMRNKFAAKLIVIDPEPPLVSEAAHVVLKGRAEQVLPDLLGMFLDKQPKIKR